MDNPANCFDVWAKQFPEYDRALRFPDEYDAMIVNKASESQYHFRQGWVSALKLVNSNTWELIHG